MPGRGGAADPRPRRLTTPPPPPPPPPRRTVRLRGGTTCDFQARPGVDVIADVSGGLGFAASASAEALFAEHFLEHLAVADALGFLLEVHRVLLPGAWVRLSTPNLDWVWQSHYRLEGEPEEKREAALPIHPPFPGGRHH